MIVHTAPHEHLWAPHVHAPQLRLDFTCADGERIGRAVILAMPALAFILEIKVEPAHRRQGIGLAIHRVLAERYGAVACETHCSADEMRVWESMARRRPEWELRLAHAPLAGGVCAIVRSGAGVRRMLVGRLKGVN